MFGRAICFCSTGMDYGICIILLNLHREIVFFFPNTVYSICSRENWVHVSVQYGIRLQTRTCVGCSYDSLNMKDKVSVAFVGTGFVRHMQ
jgi:hypothetical protein